MTIRVQAVHHAYGVWDISPPNGTPRIPFWGRTYNRSSVVEGVPATYIKIGTAPNGGEILGPPLSSTPVEVFVKYPGDPAIPYVLSGGP